MLEPPAIRPQAILDCLSQNYQIHAVRVDFLPLGADHNTAVFRAETGVGDAYFVKVRFGPFHEASVTLPRFLCDQGIASIIPPLTSQNGKPWASLGTATLILYPFVAGQNGRRVPLSAANWQAFGAALRRVHTTTLPAGLRAVLPQESYSSRWGENLGDLLDAAQSEAFADPVAVEMAAFLRLRRGEIIDLIQRADELGRDLRNRNLTLVLCHSDIHAGNVLIGSDQRVHMVDWDAPILAPKERDLMYIGGAQGFVGWSAQEEEAHFYGGYGQVAVDWAAVAYYRYARIVEDLAIYAQELLLSDAGGADRPQSLLYAKSNFLADGTVSAARQADGR